MSKPKDVINFRKRIKIALVEAFGHKCSICGLVDEVYIYDFHHINPSTKAFGISGQNTHGKELIVEEAKKCVMLCSNCHRRIENTLTTIELICNFDEKVFYQTIEKLTTNNLSEEKQQQQQLIQEKRNSYPNREELKKLIRSKPFTQIGIQYELTDNSIRKWCDKFNLPRTKKEINSYSDEEWDLI